MTSLAYVQCVSCGGVYPPTQSDGTSYCHACPPSKVTAPAVVDPATGKVTAPAVLAPMPNPRNENIRVDPDSGKVSIIAAGGGVIPATAPAPLTAPAILGG